MKKSFVYHSRNKVLRVTLGVLLNAPGDDDFSDCDGSEVSAEEGTPDLPDYAD